METIKIEEIQEKLTTTGKKYFKIVTDNHKAYSCWDFDLVADLKVGYWYNITTTEKNGYYTIKTAAPGVAPATITTIASKNSESYSPAKKEDSKERLASMLMSYTKDLMVAVIAKKDNFTELDVLARECSKVVYSAYRDFYTQLSNTA